MAVVPITKVQEMPAATATEVTVLSAQLERLGVREEPSAPAQAISVELAVMGQMPPPLMRAAVVAVAEQAFLA